MDKVPAVIGLQREPNSTRSIKLPRSRMDPARAADKRHNIVMLMTDDTGWNDFGCYSGGSISMVRTSTEHEPTSAASARKRTWAQSCALSTLEKVELRRSTKKKEKKCNPYLPDSFE